MRNASLDPVSFLAQQGVIFDAGVSLLALFGDRSYQPYRVIEVHDLVLCSSTGHPPVKEREGLYPGTTPGMEPTLISWSPIGQGSLCRSL